MAIYRSQVIEANQRRPQTTAASEQKETPTGGEVWGGVFFFVVCVLVGVGIIDSDVRFEPPDGISTFALFYVIALAMERFFEFLDVPLELLASFIGRRQSKQKLEEDRNEALADALRSDDQEKAKRAADTQARVNQATRSRSAFLAGMAAGLGVLAADYLNADFLRAVGATGAPHWLALTVTGLVVAGGSKQLHDLIANVSKSSEQKKTPGGAGGAVLS